MVKHPAPQAGSPLATGSEHQPAPVVARGEDDAPAVRTLHCRTVAQGRFQQLHYIRHLSPRPLEGDQPESLLSEDFAPNASEALLAALGSCLAVGIHANAVAQRIPLHRLELELEADIYTTAAWDAGSVDPKPIGFEAVHVTVHLEADARRSTLAALVKHAVLWSPVSNTLYNPVHLDVALAEDKIPP